mgnify:CR=1 FL=1
MSQSPDEDSLSSDVQTASSGVWTRIEVSQSPDEDSLSSDRVRVRVYACARARGLNPLTRIHCLPTIKLFWKLDPVRNIGLNPLTRIHCLPTIIVQFPLLTINSQ